jgi:ABC-type branched-subunit amino acid transport system ATPase component
MGCNLKLEKREVCCVIGEEGSGKSTLLKSITQQLPTSGSILYHGIDLSRVSTANLTKRGIDFVSQGGNILESFTVEEHINLSLRRTCRASRSSTWHQIENAFPSLCKLRKQVAGRLSGGERMILSIACLLATDADLLLLDEPTAGLAPETCVSIKHFLFRMKNELGKTMLLFEHNYDFAFEVADSVVTLKEGRLSEKYMPHVFQRTGFIETNLYSMNP